MHSQGWISSNVTQEDSCQSTRTVPCFWYYDLNQYQTRLYTSFYPGDQKGFIKWPMVWHTSSAVPQILVFRASTCNFQNDFHTLLLFLSLFASDLSGFTASTLLHNADKDNSGGKMQKPLWEISLVWAQYYSS